MPERKSDEEIASFLDGRLTGLEREEMLGHLVESAEDRAHLAGTADVLRQLEEEDAAAALPAPPDVLQPDPGAMTYQGRFKLYRLEDSDGERHHFAAVNGLQALREFYQITAGTDETAESDVVDDVAIGFIGIEPCPPGDPLSVDTPEDSGQRTQTCAGWAIEAEIINPAGLAALVSSTSDIA
jgi:hypothetical protein